MDDEETIFYFAKRAFSNVLEGVASKTFLRASPQPPFFRGMPMKHDYFGTYSLPIEAGMYHINAPGS